MITSGKTLVLSGALLAAIGAAAVAAPCTTGTLASYIALPAAGCSVDDKTFSAFVYVPSQSGVPTAAQITVTPEGADPTRPGLLFSDSWSTPPGIGEDAVLLFTVTETGAGSIIGAELQVSGTGSFNDTETQVPPGQLNLVATDNTLQSQLFATPETTIRVSDDILLNAGASISSIDKRFDQPPPFFPPLVPEPGTLSILGSALLLLVALGLRRRDLLMAS